MILWSTLSRAVRGSVLRGFQGSPLMPLRSLSSLSHRPSSGPVNKTWPLTPSSVALFHSSSPRLDTSDEFKKALAASSSLPAADNATKLRLYALYKQATLGKNTSKKPGMMDIVGKAKWEAWNGLGEMTTADAQAKYVQEINSMMGQASKGQEQSSSSSSSEEDGLVVTKEGGIMTIRLNRPKKKNALTMEMYIKLTQTLLDSNSDSSVRIIVLTGTGDYYCSGNDLGNFMNVSDPVAMAKRAKELLQAYVAAYVEVKKPLIALVNGPAVGIAVTVLGLCDAVFCSDQSTFVSPFSSLGQSPEGCSSYTFPRIMGYAKAGELLYFNQKFSAKQAEAAGLVTAVFPHETFQSEAWKRVKDMAELPIKSLVFSKELVRGRETALLHEVNVKECERLEERWTSEDCMNAIMKFFSARS